MASSSETPLCASQPQKARMFFVHEILDIGTDLKVVGIGKEQVDLWSFDMLVWS